MSIDKDLLDRLNGRPLAQRPVWQEPAFLAELTKALAERALSTEMDVHLDEERAEEAPEGQNQPSNRRNGRSQKTVTTDSGKVVLDIPRDRNGHLRSAADRQVSGAVSRNSIARSSACMPAA